MNIIGDMLADCGLTVAFPAESEAAWLSITRTQPALVICDSGVPAASIKRLITEVASRRLPLLMAWSREEHDEYAAELVLPDRVAWFTFPIDCDTFRSTIDGLLSQPIDQAHRLKLTAAGVTFEAAVNARTLDEALHGGTAVTAGRSSAIPDRTVRRSIRLLP